MRWAYRIDGILGRHVDDASLAKYSTNDLGYADDSALFGGVVRTIGPVCSTISTAIYWVGT